MDDIIVLKCGGSILAELTDSFFTSIKELQNQGFKVIVVHGGGPEIGDMLKSLEIPSEFVNGLRKTTSDVLNIVEMILSGSVNKQLVSKLTSHGLNALGLSGIDGKLITAGPIDKDNLGFVGEVTYVNSQLLTQLIEMDFLPVISPLGADQEGQKYNINADTAAASIASALHAKHLLFVTNVPGILKEGEVLDVVSTTQVKDLISDGTIYGGMIPKVNAALSALSAELSEVMIVNGKDSIVTLDGKLAGTKLIKELEAI